MPSNVPAASATTVLPAHLCRQFERQHAWPVEENVFANGERQSRARTTTPTISWNIRPVLSEAQQTEMLTFLRARKGIEPFYFYDWTEGAHDPSGSSSIGRYVVIARPLISLARGLGRRALMNLILEQRA